MTTTQIIDEIQINVSGELDKLAVQLLNETIDAKDTKIINDLLEEETLIPRINNKPEIDQLADALDKDGHPLFLVGDKIVIERYISIMPGNAWLDTRLVVVKAIDPLTGDLLLIDPDLRQSVYCNYIKGPRLGYRFKLSPKFGPGVGGKRKRGRPRKTLKKIEAVPQLDANGKPIKKNRGRPKGTKNRPRDEVEAEKRAKEQNKDAKRQKRLAKRTKY